MRYEISVLRLELKQEIADLRLELKQEIADLRSELKQEIADLRSELKQEIADLRSELHHETARIWQEIAALRVSGRPRGRRASLRRAPRSRRCRRTTWQRPRGHSIKMRRCCRW
ncbi:MAG: hypothetical protein EB062_07240 [Actinobacteria bacterium]|nr:hypothetical protein [Actinomycetota bacterium]